MTMRELIGSAASSWIGAVTSLSPPGRSSGSRKRIRSVSGDGTRPRSGSPVMAAKLAQPVPGRRMPAQPGQHIEKQREVEIRLPVALPVGRFLFAVIFRLLARLQEAAHLPGHILGCCSSCRAGVFDRGESLRLIRRSIAVEID